ncbi:MAG TPA: hypothetical protein VIG93_09740 [Gaiellaceae bacterium]
MVSAWEAIFMLVILKIPLIYLAVVVWWAVRAEPAPHDGTESVGALVPLTPCGWDDWRRRRYSARFSKRPIRPLGRPSRRVYVEAAA